VTTGPDFPQPDHGFPPPDPSLPPPRLEGTGREAALVKVKFPAIAMLVLAALSILASIGSLFAMGAVRDFYAKLAEQNPDMQPLVDMMGGTYLWISAVIGVVINALILFGSIRMMQGRSYGWAMSAAVLTLVGTVLSSCCCCLSLPIGIWALVVLLKDEVKAAFTA
jgi:hypothetical protein